eukprot:5102934-Prymnesium_polylepis.1
MSRVQLHERIAVHRLGQVGQGHRHGFGKLYECTRGSDAWRNQLKSGVSGNITPSIVPSPTAELSSMLSARPKPLGIAICGDHCGVQRSHALLHCLWPMADVVARG